MPVYRTPMGSADALVRDGAIVVGELTLDRRASEAMLMRGEFPPKQQVNLQVDTGAAMSIVEIGYAASLGLEPVRYTRLTSVGHEPRQAPVYRAVLRLGFEGDGNSQVIPLPITFAGVPQTFANCHFQGLLGRDFLRDFSLIYNGKTGLFEMHR